MNEFFRAICTPRHAKFARISGTHTLAHIPEMTIVTFLCAYTADITHYPHHLYF